mgnify:CR=1 FL=1|jgi:uncharacterized protein with WD repeat
MVQTGKPRISRPDGRNLSKVRRRKETKLRLAAAEAKDLKITKLSSKERKEREVMYDGKGDKTNNAKLLRALRKKLRAIEDLKVKQSKGLMLDLQQLEKLELEEETRENLTQLENIEEGEG